MQKFHHMVAEYRFVSKSETAMSSKETASTEAPSRAPAASDPPSPPPADMSRPPAPVPEGVEIVHVRPIAGDVDPEQLKEVFSAFGTVKNVRLIANREFGFVDFADLQSAERAIREGTGIEFMGRKLTVEMARSKFGDNPHERRRDNFGRGRVESYRDDRDRRYVEHDRYDYRDYREHRHRDHDPYRDRDPYRDHGPYYSYRDSHHRGRDYDDRDRDRYGYRDEMDRGRCEVIDTRRGRDDDDSDYGRRSRRDGY